MLVPVTITLAVVAAFKSSGTTQVFSTFYGTSFIASPKGSKKKTMKRRGLRGHKDGKLFRQLQCWKHRQKKTAWCVNKHTFQTRMAEPDDETHTLSSDVKKKTTKKRRQTNSAYVSSCVATAMKGDAA